jgi:hypothetical protein
LKGELTSFKKQEPAIEQGITYSEGLKCAGTVVIFCKVVCVVRGKGRGVSSDYNAYGRAGSLGHAPPSFRRAR